MSTNVPEQPEPSAGGTDAPVENSPPPGPPLALPCTIAGTWSRDLRIGGELVAKGTLTLTAEGVEVRGRRSSPLRALLWTSFWVGWWFGGLAAFVASGMTVIGIGNWAQSPEAMASGAVCIFPVVLVAALMLRWMARGLLEPTVTWTVPWAEVARLAADGRSVQVKLRTQGGSWLGRLVPDKGPSNQIALAAIRDGRVPHGERASGWWRPPVVDKLLLASALAGLGYCAVLVAPDVAALMRQADEPRTGPLAGIPHHLGAGRIEAFLGGCANGATPGILRNRRDGDALTWVSSQELETLHLRWQAGTSRTELVGAPRAGGSGRIEGFFRDADHVGVSLLVAPESSGHVQGLLSGGDLSALRSAWCGGLVARLDMTQAEPGAGLVRARREQDDLVIEVEGVDPQAFGVLPVRWYPVPGPETFHPCAIPQDQVQVGLLDAHPTRRIPDFFDGPGQQARVYLVDRRREAAAQALVEGGTLQACLVPESLLFSGAASGMAKTAEVSAFDQLQERAASLAANPPMVPVTVSAAEAVDAITSRYVRVATELDSGHLSLEQQRAVNAGFLSAIRWNAVLDSVSFSRSLPRLEVMRQRLSGADPTGRAGEMVLLAFAEAFLERLQPGAGAYEERVGVGERWLAVEAGTEWTLDGRVVRVPDARTAAFYQLIGRYVLVDVARRVEEDLAADGSGVVPAGLRPLVSRLEGHKVSIDPRKSTSTKALEAWLGGDFEYLADRALKKVEANLSDQRVAVAEAWTSAYALRDSGGDGRHVRYAALVRDGREIGWVGLFASAGTRVSYVLASDTALNTSELTAKAGGQLLVAAAGSYVTATGETSGLAAFGGRIENFLISPKMDGLVLVHPEHGVHLLDMRAGGELPGRSGELRPLRSLSDLQELTAWIEAEGASAFQTHLLVTPRGFAIDEETSDPDLRERRLLVQGAYNGSPVFAMVDLPGTSPVSLFEAAVIAARALETPESEGGPGWQVQAVANLDVGSYDILEVWGPMGEHRRGGPNPLSGAHNLVLVSLR